MTVNGQVSGLQDGNSQHVGIRRRRASSSEYRMGKDGFQHAVVFVGADTDPTTDRPEIDLTAYASATYGVLCLPDDPWNCQYSQGSASIPLSSMTIQALVATTVPAVPEAEGVWLALVGGSRLGCS